MIKLGQRRDLGQNQVPLELFLGKVGVDGTQYSQISMKAQIAANTSAFLAPP